MLYRVLVLEYKVNGFFVKLVYLQETIKLEYRERRIINVVSPLSSRLHKLSEQSQQQQRQQKPLIEKSL